MCNIIFFDILNHVLFTKINIYLDVDYILVKNTHSWKLTANCSPLKA